VTHAWRRKLLFIVAPVLVLTAIVASLCVSWAPKRHSSDVYRAVRPEGWRFFRTKTAGFWARRSTSSVGERYDVRTVAEQQSTLVARDAVIVRTRSLTGPIVALVDSSAGTLIIDAPSEASLRRVTAASQGARYALVSGDCWAIARQSTIVGCNGTDTDTTVAPDAGLPTAIDTYAGHVAVAFEKVTVLYQRQLNALVPLGEVRLPLPRWDGGVQVLLQDDARQLTTVAVDASSFTLAEGVLRADRTDSYVSSFGFDEDRIRFGVRTDTGVRLVEVQRHTPLRREQMRPYRGNEILLFVGARCDVIANTRTGAVSLAVVVTGERIPLLTVGKELSSSLSMEFDFDTAYLDGFVVTSDAAWWSVHSLTQCSTTY